MSCTRATVFSEGPVIPEASGIGRRYLQVVHAGEGASVQRAPGCHPLGGLSGHVGDPVEDGVVVEEDQVVDLGGGGDQEVRYGEAVLTQPSEQPLDLQGLVRDLGIDGDLGKMAACSRSERECLGQHRRGRSYWWCAP
jgi:hypothetical protein